MYVCYIRHFFSFFAPLVALGLILVRHFLKECSNATMLWSGKSTEDQGFFISQGERCGKGVGGDGSKHFKCMIKHQLQAFTPLGLVY